MKDSEIVKMPQQQEIMAAVPAALIEDAKRYAFGARSANTERAYQSDWRRFATWCASLGLNPLPASPEVLALYLTHRANEGRRPTVLEREMAAISVAHRKSGFVLPNADPLVREVFAGIRRTKKVATRQATPLLPPDLKKISKILPDSLAGKRDRCMLSVGFNGALRRDELSNLLIQDITFRDEGVTILIRSSKTDQIGAGALIGLPYASDPLLCPVRTIRAWLEASHLKSGFLFRQIGRCDVLRHTRISGQGIAMVIQARAKQAGLMDEKISGHSLRAGFATAAARAGKSMTAIQRQTRHKSLATVAKYVREGTLFEDNAATGIGL